MLLFIHSALQNISIHCYANRRQMLYDLHVALNLHVETDLKPLIRMIRYLPFYQQTGKNLDQLPLPYTTASEQINQMLRKPEIL